MALGINGYGSISSSHSSNYVQGKIWSYNFNSLRVQKLHFNIKVINKRNGKKVTSGWNPAQWWRLYI